MSVFNLFGEKAEMISIFSSKNTNKIWTGNYRKISTTGRTIFTWFWWPEKGMRLIYKINCTGKNFQSGMTSDRCTLNTIMQVVRLHDTMRWAGTVGGNGLRVCMEWRQHL